MINEDNSLIKKAQEGDMKAFEQLLYKYDKQVLNIAFSFRNDEEDAKDMYQEVFLRVYKNLKKFQFKSEFGTWLYRITTNVCISHQSKRKKHQLDSIDKEIGFDGENPLTLKDYISDNSESESKIMASDLSNHINSAIEKLPAKQKMAFTLKFYQEYKIREIAKMMNCTEGTIKRYLFTAANKMRENLKGLRKI